VAYQSRFAQGRVHFIRVSCDQVQFTLCGNLDPEFPHVHDAAKGEVINEQENNPG
jgi:hypothetical protein